MMKQERKKDNSKKTVIMVKDRKKEKLQGETQVNIDPKVTR